MIKLNLTKNQYFDCLNLSDGLFYPVTGFLDKENFISVINNLKLSNESPWVYPVSLDIDPKHKQSLKVGQKIDLFYDGKLFGSLNVSDFFFVDNKEIALTLFGTTDLNHPGVAFELNKSNFRIGGEIEIRRNKGKKDFTSVSQIKEMISKTGAQTFVGFQTRNPPHRAHEYIHRTVLELYDGLLINPLTGWKKSGDFKEEAVMSGYNAMIKNYYKECNIILEPLRTSMLYAGPKEAIHHALMRRNMGCTHFVVGRDHAGVSDYYENYEAHSFIQKMIKKGYDFGIKFILIKEPVYCYKCQHVVTEKSCGHLPSEAHLRISGSMVRKYLHNGLVPPEQFMRPEVSKSLLGMKDDLFILEEI